MKFAGVPQTPETISAVSGPKFTILSAHVEEVLLFMVALCNRADHYIFALWYLSFLLSSNVSSTCPHNMVNFGPLTADIVSGVWGTPANFNWFASWQRYCTASSSGRQPNFAALNRRRHLCSAGQPSHWALTHILVCVHLWLGLDVFLLEILGCHFMSLVIA